MKIVFSNWNISKWIFGIAHLIPIIIYCNYGVYMGDTTLINPAFMVPTGIIGGIWIFILLDFLVKCAAGDIEFTFEIKLFHNYFEQKRQRRAIKKQILELKSKALARMDDVQHFEQIINQIIKLEERL